MCVLRLILDMENISTTPEENSHQIPAEHTKNRTDISITSIAADSLQFILKEKANNKSDGYLIGGLLERGFEYEEAEALLEQLPQYIEEQFAKANNHLLTGILFVAIGFSVNVLPLSGQSGLALSILANATLIAGVLRIIHGYQNKRRFNVLKSW